MIPCFLCGEVGDDENRIICYPFGERVIQSDVCDPCWESHIEMFGYEY